MKYADTSVTGAALTKSNPTTFPMQWRGQFTNGNTIFFYTATPTYLSLGNKSQFPDCRKIMICPSYGRNLLNVTSGKYILCSNMVNNGDYTIKYAYFDFDETKIKILVNTTLHTWDFTKYSWQSSTTIILRLGIDGTPYLNTPAALKLTNHTTETVTDIGNDCVYVNAYRDANGNMVVTDADFTYVVYRDGVFGCSDELDHYTATGVVATHHYALAEGEGDIVYDNIGNNDGKLITSSMSNSRKIYSAAQSYNSLVGFKEDSNIDTAISKAKIPMHKDFILYKSDFIEDGFSNISSTLFEPSLTSDGKMLITASTPYIQFDLSLPFTLTTENSNRKFKLKFKIKNLESEVSVLDDLQASIGDNIGDYNSWCYANKQNVSIPVNAETEITIDFPSAYSEHSYNSRLFLAFTFNSGEDHKFEISDIILTQVDSLTSYPAVKDGKNKAEANLDYSQLLGNIAETGCRYLIPNTWWQPVIQTSSTFGADDLEAWNISTKPTTKITKKDWIVNGPNTHVYYLKNHDTSDLPSGVSYGIDLKVDSFISTTPSYWCLYNQYPSTTSKIWLEKLYKFKIKYSFWYKLNELTDNGELILGIYYNRIFSLNNKDITDTNWHFVEEEKEVVIQNAVTANVATSIGVSWRGWRDGSTLATDTADTTYYVGSLADIKYEILPTWDSYRPIYAKMNYDKKELSNIMVYNMKQHGNELTRIKNHVNNF